MKCFNADFHIHSCLSPCADLSMTPRFLARRLSELGIDWVAITDHNSTRNLEPFSQAFTQAGIALLLGMEIQTQEDVHLLAYFPDFEQARSMGKLVESHLPVLEVDPERNGYQLEVDASDQFTGMCEKALGFSTDLTLEQAVQATRQRNGEVVFAHVFRHFGVITQLGLLPETLPDVPCEVYREDQLAGPFPWRGARTILCSSDAHHPDALRPARMKVCAMNRSFEEFQKALRKQEGRGIELCH